MFSLACGMVSVWEYAGNNKKYNNNEKNDLGNRDDDMGVSEKIKG